MAEYPSIKPASDLTWAESGRRADPLDRREPGWQSGREPPLEEWNWWDREEERHQSWIDARAPRAFDNLPDAIDAVPEGDIFYLRIPLTDALTSKPSKNGAATISHLACDGRHIFYVQSGELIAAKARPSAGAEVDWFTTLAADGITGTVQAIDTDGQIVAVVATGGTNQLGIYNATTGANVFAGTVSGTPSAVKCDSDGTDSAGYRAFIDNQTTTLSLWTVGSGVAAFHVFAGVSHGPPMGLSTEFLIVGSVVIPRLGGSSGGSPGAAVLASGSDGNVKIALTAAQKTVSSLVGGLGRSWQLTGSFSRAWTYGMRPGILAISGRGHSTADGLLESISRDIFDGLYSWTDSGGTLAASRLPTLPGWWYRPVTPSLPIPQYRLAHPLLRRDR